MLKLLRWLDDNILSFLAAFLLIFIPLYPKLPLIDALPGYIVRVRLEDFAVAATALLWLLFVLRGKIKITQNPLLKPIIFYLIAGLLSIISAIFIIQTIPHEWLHINKLLLHYARRIEYFSLFFIFYSSIKSLKQIKVYFVLFMLTILAVALYGFGQKYFYWPAFSTMNREFSKGWVLYLTQHARVLSTFGGHYDLAAFIMMALLLLWSLFFSVKKIIYKVLIFLILAAAFWTIILTASRASFIAYLVGLPFMFFFWSYKKGIRWSFSRWLVVTFLSIVVMLSFGDLSERFTHLLRIDERISGIKLLLLSPIGKPPSDKALFLENNPKEAIAQITSKSDQPPTIAGKTRPSDVYQDIPLMVPEASDSASVSAIARTYSKTAFMYDLSTAIRFDALWPMAIAGFKRNPLLGSGYANLNKTQFNQFTEAESTDNDYLRALGETGLLGFVTFFGILVAILYIIWRNLLAVRDPFLFGAVVALVGSILGLMTNALYIDVFESSKVAFTFWAFTGLVLGGIRLEKVYRSKDTPKPYIPDLPDFSKIAREKIKRTLKGDKFYLLLILILALVLRLYKINTPLADWHSWRQADTSAVTRNYVRNGINLLYPTYDDLSNVASGKDNPKGLRFVEFPLYNIASVFIDKIFVGYNIEVSGRLTSIFATLGTVVFLFLLVRKYLGRTTAHLTALIYSILPYNIFFTRVILPEPFLVFTSTGMIYFFDKFVEKISNSSQAGKRHLSVLRYYINIIIFLIVSLIFTVSSLLVKPFAIFLVLPMIYLWFKNLGISIKSVIGFLVYWVIGLLPLVWWRTWISHFPEGIPAYTWLFNGDGIRFKGAFFQWIFADRLGREILGYWGLPLFIVGVMSKANKNLFYIWGASILIYVFTIATGNVRHDYYQTFTIPIISIFIACGILGLFELADDRISRIKTVILLVIVFIFMEMFGWYQIRDLYNINHPEIVEAGDAVERKTPKNSLVIAPYNGDTAFLYQTRRAGWPILEDPIDKMIKRGAQFYVSVNFDSLTTGLIKEAMITDPLKKRFKIIEETNKYVIIQLVSDQELRK